VYDRDKPGDDGAISGRFRPLDFRLELKAPLRAFLVVQPELGFAISGPTTSSITLLRLLTCGHRRCLRLEKTVESCRSCLLAFAGQRRN
jgi:hypothetical protein